MIKTKLLPHLLFFSLIAGSAIAQVTPPVTSAPLANLSARARIGTGDHVLIGGFVLSGDASDGNASRKRILISARGMSLPDTVAGRIYDPMVTIFQNGVPIASSNDWQNESQAVSIANFDEFPSENAAPTDAAVVVFVLPGAYTAIVEGYGGAQGIGIVEIFDLEPESPSKLINISARAYVETGDNVLIGGLVVGGEDGEVANVVVRGRGPTVGGGLLSGVLADPTLTLFDGSVPVSINDNWTTSPTAAQLGVLTPIIGFEAAMVEMFTAGSSRTAILSGVGGASGIGLVEFFITD